MSTKNDYRVYWCVYTDVYILLSVLYIIMILNHLDCIKINHKGYNISCINVDDGFMATMRSSTPTNYMPECINYTHILKMDSNFNILQSELLDESLERDRHLSFSSGIEDARLIDDKTFTCLSLDTNAMWKPEVCYVEFENSKVTIIRSLYIEGEQYTKIEKNWVLLKRDENIMYFLYWYNPLVVIKVDIDTGKGNKIISHDISNLNLNAHGGSCLYLEKEKKYLVIVRNFIQNTYTYESNCFLLLDENYNLYGYSDNFRFSNSYNGYEMCLSLLLKDDILYCFVSLYCIVSVCEEADNFVYKYYLSDILSSIHLYQKI